MRTSRRKFLQNTSALAAGAGLAGLFAGPLRSEHRPVAPSDKIRIGLVGCNGMGFTDLRAHLNYPEIEAVALCDVDRNVLNQRAEELEQITRKKPALFGDYRALLDDKEIDAVIIGTPDHWHPLIMIGACQAGKDVYCEKPLANSIEECNRMAEAAQKYGRIVQIGQWQRSGPHWQTVREIVQSGRLGKIRLTKAWAYQGWMKNVPVVPDEPAPPGVDYDMWLGPAPHRPFNRNRFHFTFRWFWDYAGGLMTDWGVHMIDMILFATDAVAPKSVVSLGGKYAYPDGGMETPDTQQAIYEFDDFSMIWEHAVNISNGPYGRDHGVAFIGNNGTLVADRGGWEIIPEIEQGRTAPNRGKPLMEAASHEMSGPAHLLLHAGDFINSMKNRTRPVCNPDVGRLAAVNAHLGNVAYKLGRRVFWDEAQGRFTNDDEANAMLMNPYRDPWSLPTV